MSCGIYKITNNINNKIYIGKAFDIQRRWSEHKVAINNPNKQYHLYRAMRKYGIENFSMEIIEECPIDNDILYEREQYWINYYDSYNKGYNQTLGGEGTIKVKQEDIESLWDKGLCVAAIAIQLNCKPQTIRNRLQNYKNYSTDEATKRANLSSHKRDAISKNHSYSFGGTPVHQYTLEGKYVASYNSVKDAAKVLGHLVDNSIGRALDPADKTHFSAYGYQWSRDKVDKLPPYYPPNCNPVRNINTGTIFTSLRQAAAWAKIDKEGIRRVINGTRKTAGKHPETGEPLYWEAIR